MGTMSIRVSAVGVTTLHSKMVRLSGIEAYLSSLNLKDLGALNDDAWYERIKADFGWMHGRRSRLQLDNLNTEGTQRIHHI